MCWQYIYQWHNRNKLTINKNIYAVMVFGSKMQLQPLNLDHFSIHLEGNKFELVSKATYLCLLVKDNLRLDDHILQLCKGMNYSFMPFAEWIRYFPSSYC